MEGRTLRLDVIRSYVWRSKDYVQVLWEDTTVPRSSMYSIAPV
jgi:hypothetical protein